MVLHDHALQLKQFYKAGCVSKHDNAPHNLQRYSPLCGASLGVANTIWRGMSVVY